MSYPRSKNILPTPKYERFFYGTFPKDAGSRLFLYKISIDQESEISGKADNASFNVSS